GDAEIPRELRYLVERGTALGMELNASLESLQSLLDEASRLIDARQLGTAEIKLVRAGAEIEVARETLAELDEAVGALSRRLAFSVMPARLAQAYNQVTASLESLEALIEEFARLRQQLETARQAVLQSELIATDLQIEVLPLEVFWGENFTVTGRLTGGDAGFGGRSVLLLAGGRSFVVTTGDDGFYSLKTVAAPDDYSGSLAVTAYYRASGEDMSRYLSAESRTVILKVGFNTTRLEVTVPDKAFTGQPVTVYGRIVASDVTLPRTTRLFWDGASLAEGVFREEFSIGFEAPSSGTGEHVLEVAVLPRDSYAGTSARLPVSLLAGIISADIETPAVVFVPRTVRLGGQVFADGIPLENAAVNVGLGGGQSRATTSRGGSFEVALAVPFNLLMIGPQMLDISITPDEPWLKPLRATPTVVMLNPAAIGLLALSMLFIVLALIRRRAPLRQAVPVAAVAPVGLAGGGAVASAVETVSPAFAGERGRVLSAYLRALELVAVACGAVPEPHTTLREYLAVARRLDGAESFKELTGLAELVLYAPRLPASPLVSRSAQLADDIKRRLRQ
ncbi:MAG: hypothetical protein C4555_04045, partial [Dehalococcoidia bacterium]